jgi:hypothetical protein
MALGMPDRACCERWFPPPSHRTAPLPLPAFPIDVVYTWVDGMDPNHAAKRAQHLPTGRPEHGAGPALFRDNDELRYSLRSLAQYAPWVRRVHLVTDRQRPSWLRERPGLAVVDHAEIIPSRFLPTFNSHVIEAYLYRIPGLAEHYIYCNDDFFLATPTAPGDFFTANGLPFLFVDGRESRREGYERHPTPHARSWFNTRAELERRGFPAPDVIAAHGPHAQTRENAKNTFTFFAEAIAGFSGNRFRTDREMAFYCHAAALWTYVFKKAVPCDVIWQYVNTKRRRRRQLYAGLLARKAAGRAPLFLCLNDVPVKGPRLLWRRQQARFMKAYWPVPSPWEKE